MEDQVITPKAKFDKMEQELKDLREEIKKRESYLNIKLSLEYDTYHNYYGRDFSNPVFTYRITKPEDLPEEINIRIDTFIQLLEKKKKDLDSLRVSVKEEFNISEKAINENQKILAEIKQRVEELPKWLKWMLKINVKKHDNG